MAGTFVVLGEHRVAYLDFHGSGAETIAHLRDNGRITIMFCAFDGPPNIVRLHGRGSAVPVDDPRHDELLARFPDPPTSRPALGDHRRRGPGQRLLRLRRAADGYEGDRDLLVRAARARTDADLVDYRRTQNAASIDGLPVFS